MYIDRSRSAAYVVLTSLFISTLCLADSGDRPEPTVQRLDNETPQRILFVGNSYLYYNDSLHNHVQRMAEENGPHDEYQFKSATIGGASLSHHYIDSLLEPGRLGVDEPFDLVILQGGSFEPLTDEGRSAFAEVAAELDAKIRATGAETALYMTHAYVEPDERYAPGMIRTIEQTYVTNANELGALAIPVGLAFELAYERRPDIVLHKTFDGTHPSMLGTYLAACVVYGSIYDRPASDLEYLYFGEVGEDDAVFLRAIADETVREFYDR